MLFGFPDIFGWISDKMNDLLKALAAVFEKVIIDPYRLPGGDITDYLTGNSWNLAISLVPGVLVFVLFAAMLLPRFFGNFLRLLIVMFVLGVGVSFFMSVCDVLTDFGDAMAKLAFFYTPSHNPNGAYLKLPQVVNPLGAMFGFAMVLAWGSVDAIIATCYNGTHSSNQSAVSNRPGVQRRWQAWQAVPASGNRCRCR